MTTTVPDLVTFVPLVVPVGGKRPNRLLMPLGYAADKTIARRQLVVCAEPELISRGYFAVVNVRDYHSGGVSAQTLTRALAQTSVQLPLVLGVYRHYKGHYYLAIGHVLDLAIPGRSAVLYVGLELDEAGPGGRLFVRDVADWTAEAEGKPHFEYVGPTWQGQPPELPGDCDGCGQLIVAGEHYLDIRVAFRTALDPALIRFIGTPAASLQVHVHNPDCFAAWARRHPLIQNVFNH